MKSRYYTYNPVKGTLSTGGFDSLSAALGYVQASSPGSLILRDRREDPSPEAAAIVRRVWVQGKTLTPAEYATLSRLAMLDDTPPEQHPPAMFLALALSGQLSAWEDAGKLHRENIVPRSIP
jgi:hypothetical protein